MKLPKKIQTVADAEKFFSLLSDVYLAQKAVRFDKYLQIEKLRMEALDAYVEAMSELNVAVASIEFNLVAKTPKPRRARAKARR